MTEQEVKYVVKCIKDDNLHRFYVWKKWLQVRQIVLAMDKHECQDCKQKGKYTKATTVHHVNYVRKHPDKALEIWYVWQGTRIRNLVSLCHDCHEERHGYRKLKQQEVLTEERWD